MDDLLPTLGTIARINRGDKLRVKGKYIVIDNRYAQWLFRFWDKEGRDSTIDFLKQIYRNAKRTVDELLVCVKDHSPEKKDTVSHRDKCRRLKDIGIRIGESCIGIKNLETTYSDCPNILAELDCICNSIIEPTYNEIYNALSGLSEFAIPEKKFGDVNSFKK